MMNNCKFSLDNHLSTVWSAINNFRLTNKFTDVCFIADKTKLYVNSTILAAFSPFMEQILSEHNNTPVICVTNGISAKTMKQLIEYMYEGAVVVAPEDIQPLINAAKAYEIIGLKDCFAPNEQAVVNISQNGQQHTITSRQPPQSQVQTNFDPGLQNTSPSSSTMSQLVPQCPPQTISSQPLQQAGASGMCLSPGYGLHTAAPPHVTITTIPVAPNPSLSCNPVLFSSGVTVTSTPEPATTLSASESTTHRNLHHQFTMPAIPATVPESNSWRKQNGITETSTMLNPLAVQSNSLSMEHLPSVSSTPALSASQITTSQSSLAQITSQSSASQITTSQSSASQITTLQSSPQITSQSSVSQLTTSQSSAPQIMTSHISVSQLTTSQSSAPQITTSQSSAPQIATSQSSASQITSQSSAPQITSQSSAPQIATSQSSASQITTSQSSASQITTSQSSTPQIMTSQCSAPQITTSQSSVPQIMTSQSSAPQIATSQSSASQITSQSSAHVTTIQKPTCSTSQSSSKKSSRAANKSLSARASEDMERSSGLVIKKGRLIFPPHIDETDSISIPRVCAQDILAQLELLASAVTVNDALSTLAIPAPPTLAIPTTRNSREQVCARTKGRINEALSLADTDRPTTSRNSKSSPPKRPSTRGRPARRGRSFHSSGVQRASSRLRGDSEPSDSSSSTSGSRTVSACEWSQFENALFNGTKFAASSRLKCKTTQRGNRKNCRGPYRDDYQLRKRPNRN